jgi:hypothetical protein
MKISVLFLLLTIAISPTVTGQIDSVQVKLYNSWYDLNSVKTRQSDLFTYEFGDSTVTVVAKKIYMVGTIPEAANLRIIPVEDINNMLFRKKGRKASGAITGLVSGAIIGALLGHSRGGTSVEDSEYGDELFYVSAGFKAFAGALIGAGIGIAIGLPIGSAKKEIQIKGEVGKYQDMKPGLSKYSIRYYTH